MCLILVAYRAHPDYELLVAANRDEFHDRPTAPLAFWYPTSTAPGGSMFYTGSKFPEWQGNLLVGDRIPINSVTFNPNTSNESTYSQVQYLETGTILKVRPRVAKDGTVFMEIVQEISAPGAEVDRNGNRAIRTQKVKTEAAVQEGETIMLAGLIDDGVTSGSSGIPGLSRLPVVGGLFGHRTQNKTRRETIILITPTIVHNPQEAADLTDEYSRRFRAMQPLYPAKKK